VNEKEFRHEEFEQAFQVVNEMSLDDYLEGEARAATSWILDKVENEEGLLSRIWEWLRTNYAPLINDHVDYVIPPWHMHLMMNEEESLLVKTLAVSSFTIAYYRACEGRWEQMNLQEKMALFDFILG